ncbi:hypothetical protein VZT92_023006 [Zoarces viviparus]|uniref:Histone H2B n=1 Tax=Zoarces viviparus TaxID=48416 RepID=A0AAW1E5T8_ZOAVI
MENSDPIQKGVRTQARNNASQVMDTSEAMPVSGTSALKKEDTGSTQAVHLSSSSSSESSTESSSDMSDSSSNSSSEDNKKEKNKKGKGKKNRKKFEKVEGKTRQRAQKPEEVVARYKKNLRQFRRGGTMSAAFKHVRVDRNTVVVNALIAELYKDLLKNYSSQVKLSVFATQCATAIKEDTIKACKASGKLLPLKKKIEL